MRNLSRALKEVSLYWRIVLAIYVFQVILVSTVGLQMMQVLDASIGNSLSLEKLKTGFNYTVFTDFVNVHGGSFTVLYGQMRWMVLIYLIFASFMSSGIIYCLIHDFHQVSDFFKGGVQYFIKLFFVDLFFAFSVVAVVGVALALIGTLFGMAPTRFDTELVFLRWTLFIGLVVIFLISVLTLCKIKTKFYYVSTDYSVKKSVGQGIVSFWNHKWKGLGYCILFLFVSILLIVINYAAGDMPLLPMIIVIQLIALIKIFWRVIFYRVVGTNSIPNPRS